MLKKLCLTSMAIALILSSLYPAQAIVIKWEQLKDFNTIDLNTILKDSDIISIDELNQILSNPENNGVVDPNHTIPIKPVSIEGKDGRINWDVLLDDPEFGANIYQIANGSLKLGNKEGGVPISIDYVKLSQILQVSTQAVAENSKQNQANNEATESIFQDAANVYGEVASTPPNSTLEAIEQSNKIAIANGLVGMSQTKHVQALVSSLEVSNALDLSELEKARADRFKAQISIGIADRDLALSREFSNR
jgi:hypothetical protein